MMADTDKAIWHPIVDGWLNRETIKLPLTWPAGTAATLIDPFAHFVEPCVDQVFAVMWTASHVRFELLTAFPKEAQAYLESSYRRALWEKRVMLRRLQLDPSFQRKLTPLPLPNVRLADLEGRPITVRGREHAGEMPHA